MGRRIIDLTLPLTGGLPGYAWNLARDLDRDGWNAWNGSKKTRSN